MYEGTITFEATGQSENQVIEAILFDIHEEFRRDGQGISVEKVNKKFQCWYQDNKHNDSVQRIYRGIIEENPDYSLTFMNWCKKKYYPECVDI